MGRSAARLGAGGLLALALVVGIGAGPALACGGLVGPGGTVQLARTTTLAAYHDGVEHYVTAFEYNGGGAKFGSIIPLPGVPTKVEKGGDWTLQRLVRETQPLRESLQAAGASAGVADKAEVLLTAKVDALDLTVLRGGGTAVGTWAREHGFGLSPDAPAVLDFYAQRSPIFLASSFDPSRAAARGQRVGDGTPVHLTIPTSNPWVPLRILGLGLGRKDPVRADVYLLTDRRPALLRPDQGVRLDQSRAASQQLLTDLRLDRGMSWLPGSGMWLSYLTVDTTAATLQHDLAIDASGHGRPSPLAAGLDSTADIAAGELDLSSPSAILPRLLWPAVALIAALALLVALIARASNPSRR
ncbi:MAG TPA: DUF2330 domain-containing protein [Actinomycetes bacterium]